jgi:hypothetical protein
MTDFFREAFDMLKSVDLQHVLLIRAVSKYADLQLFEGLHSCILLLLLCAKIHSASLSVETMASGGDGNSSP